jgi:hypothetical protein
MRCLHTLAPVAALLALALCGPGLARAQKCPYLYGIHMEMQQQQKLYLQYQMSQAAHHQATMHAAQTAAAHPPHLLANLSSTHNQMNWGVPPAAHHFNVPSHTAYHTYHPVIHEYYALHTAPHLGHGGCWSLWWYEHYMSVHLHTQRHVIEHNRQISHLIPGRVVPTAHHSTVQQTHVVPGTHSVQQQKQVAHKDTPTTADKITARIETLTQMTAWSYARCGRCHQNDPGKTPQLTTKPQLPRLNTVPHQPNLLTDQPRPGLPVQKPRPGIDLLTGGKQPTVPGVAQRPGLPMPAPGPRLPAMSPGKPFPGQTPVAPGLARLTDGTRPTPGRTWQPSLPSWAVVVPPPPLPSQVRLPGADPLERLSEYPSSLGDTLWLTTTPGESPGQMQPAAAPGEFPTIGLVATEAPSLMSEGPIGPPDYPPLPRPAWDSATLSPSAQGQPVPAPELRRVANAAPAGIEPPPLPRTGRAWGADETLVLE